MTFKAPVDIANRGLQHCGADRISDTLGFTEDSKNAEAVGFVYDKLRRAELRRNLWRFAIRRAMLRAIDTDTMILVPALYSAQTTYFIGQVVADSDGALWVSNTNDNLGNTPQNSAQWDLYCGPLTADLYDSTISYSAGELVYKYTGDGTYQVYTSLVGANTDDPATAQDWSATTTYNLDDVVTYSSVTYRSLTNLNLNNTPSASPAAWASGTTYALNDTVSGSDGVNYTSLGNGNIGNDPTTDAGVHWSSAGVLTAWATTGLPGTGSLQWRLIQSAVLKPPSIIYPLDAGPVSQAATRNVYRLPANYLRPAPQDPKAGLSSLLGAPSGLDYSDWTFEGNYIVSRDSGPLMFRFVADIYDVTLMDDMFCEGLGCRIGFELCQELTQSNDKKQTIAAEYQKFMGEARAVNAIETGSEAPAIDDFIACRA